MICPETIEATSSPAMSGSSCSPEAVGLSPRTTCWKSGRYVSAPKRAKPTTKPDRARDREDAVAEQAQRQDRLGGAALRGREGDERARTPSAPSPTICGEPQSYVVPPSVVTSTIDGQADRQQQRAELVDRVPGARSLRRQRDGQDAEGDQRRAAG